jgi:hypothetical protein
MTRGLTDEPLPVEPEKNNDDEVTNIINELIKGQNKLHDRIIDLERQNDHKSCKCKDKTLSQEEASAEVEAADRKFWKRGL